jgi:hypothetical protein
MNSAIAVSEEQRPSNGIGEELHVSAKESNRHWREMIYRSTTLPTSRVAEKCISPKFTARKCINDIHAKVLLQKSAWLIRWKVHYTGSACETHAASSQKSSSSWCVLIVTSEVGYATQVRTKPLPIWSSSRKEPSDWSTVPLSTMPAQLEHAPARHE